MRRLPAEASAKAGIMRNSNVYEDTVRNMKRQGRVWKNKTPCTDVIGTGVEEDTKGQ